MSRNDRRPWSDGAAGPALRLVPDAGWPERGLCQGAEPSLFFPEKGGSTREARAICARCPVRQPCLAFALDNGDTWGIWGGELFAVGHLIPQPPPTSRAPDVVPDTPRCAADRHDRTEENTRKMPGNRVRCLDCERDRCRRYRQGQKAVA